MATTFNDNYQVKSGSSDDVILSVTIGYAQIASTSVTVDGVQFTAGGKDEHGNIIQPDANGNYPDSFSIVIGQNKDLPSKTVLIVSTVERVQDNEDNTSVQISCSGGVSSKTFPLLTEKIMTKGETLIYDPEIQIN